jgi:hypothetical protein
VAVEAAVQGSVVRVMQFAAAGAAATAEAGAAAVAPILFLQFLVAVKPPGADKSIACRPSHPTPHPRQGGSAWGASTLAGPDGSRKPSELELAYAKHQVGPYSRTVHWRPQSVHVCARARIGAHLLAHAAACPWNEGFTCVPGPSWLRHICASLNVWRVLPSDRPNSLCGTLPPDAGQAPG